MIPKVIHYCWFGNNKKTKLMKKCIRSWKKYCPDYEIIEWNEKNFNIDESCVYVQEAYQEKKWAFVSDYVRLKTVYEHGGIYLDTDVELINNLDEFLKHPAFFGYQNECFIATGLGFGAEKENAIVKCMLDDYENICFVGENGHLDLTPCTVRNTKAIERFLRGIDTSKICFIPDAVLYPKEYFSPIDCKTLVMNKTEKTIAIHWFTASWREEDFLITKEYHEFYQKVGRKLGKRATYLFVTTYYSLFRRKKWNYLQKKWEKDKI